MSNSHQIGSMIRSCRESKGISQDYMASMLDIAQSAYAYLESGKTTLSIDRLIRITEILDLDIHQVIEKSLPIHHHASQTSYLEQHPQKIIYSETREADDLLILELHNEIDFLRSIIIKK